MFKVKRRFLALFVAFVMVLGSFPLVAQATQYFDESSQVYYLQEQEEPMIEHDVCVLYDYVSNDITGGNNDANVFFTEKINIFEESEMLGYIDFMPHTESLQAVYEPVTLTFHSNCGNPSIQTAVRTTGQPMGTLPTPPIKDGYVFIGWFNTASIVFGDFLTVDTIVNSNNTVFWARFASIVTVPYELLVNVDTDAARTQALNSINEIRHIFFRDFGIDLVLAPGSPRYEPALNQVGINEWGHTVGCRDASEVLGVNESNNTTVVFRFVNYTLCGVAGIARGPRGVTGNRNMGDMVVTTGLTTAQLRRTVIHEIGHVFGSGECFLPHCVMNQNLNNLLYDGWCNFHRNQVHNVTTRFWRDRMDLVPPTINLNPNSININDVNLTAVVEVGGTAQDTIILNTDALPAGVGATVTNGIITVTGTRPAFGQPAITGTFTVPIRRQSQSVNLSVNVNLTPLPPTMQTVNFTAGANINVTATVNGNAITSGSVVAEGSTIVFTAIPHAGFEMSGWSVSGGVLSGTNMDTTRSIVVGATSIFVGLNAIPTESVSVSTWQGLRAAIDAAPVGVPISISITNNIQAPTIIANATVNHGYPITLPEGRHITLVSSDTTEGVANVRTLSQANQQRLFIVNPGSSLTLGQNITLCGFVTQRLRAAAGVYVRGGGELIMHPGSVIENGTGAAAVLSGSGIDEATQARFTMLGGTIQNTSGPNVGGVYVGVNSKFVMSGNSVLSGNIATSVSRDVATAGGVFLSSETSVFELRDAATVSHNFSTSIIATSNIGRAGGVMVSNGAFTMYGGSLIGNYCANSRGAGSIFVHSGSFTMHGGSITESSAPHGSVRLQGNPSARFAMYGGTIYNNIGDAIVLIHGAMTMSDGEISGNTGNGVVVGFGAIVGNATFTMSGGLIYGHASGSGVDVGCGTFNMTSYSARIENNHAVNHGGGISLGLRGTVNISAGVITGNSAPLGGGVYMARWSRAVLNMTGGSISNNEAITGGGILQQDGTVNITAGEVAGNRANRGGGVYISSMNVGAFSMIGGSIANNIATYNGGGIYSRQAAHTPLLPQSAFNNLNIGPNTIFQGNTAGNGWSAPPDNRLPHINTTTASIWDYVLNNYDINFTARLGQ